MPIYEYRCIECQEKHNAYRPMSESALSSTCPECGAASNRILSPSILGADYEPYQCPITDKWIDGKKAHEENLKLHGCRVFERGERQQWLDHKAERDALFERKVEDTVGETISSWPIEKQIKLGQELEHGITAEATRG